MRGLIDVPCSGPGCRAVPCWNMQGMRGMLLHLATGTTRGRKSAGRRAESQALVLGLLPACMHASTLTLASPLLHVPVAASMVQPSSQAMEGSTDCTSTAFSSHTSSVTLHSK